MLWDLNVFLTILIKLIIFLVMLEIANLEQKIPTEWINKDGNNITQELYDYLFPLIQGEVNVNYQNGIPAYYSCNHLNK